MWRFTSAQGATTPHLTSLNGHAGRQVWAYDEDGGTEDERAAVAAAQAAYASTRRTVKHSGDVLLRLQAASAAAAASSTPCPAPPPAGPGREAADEASTTAALHAGAAFYAGLQAPDGHWPGDYGGPLFLFPGLVIALYVTGSLEEVLTPPAVGEALRYLDNHQVRERKRRMTFGESKQWVEMKENALLASHFFFHILQNADGGFGLHIEGQSTMFGTALSYVTLRILGRPADDATVSAARAWVRSNGGPTHGTSWTKFWLALLGIYDWAGVNPMPPEAWLLPHAKWTGVGWAHPGRYWCHCRQVYMPMAYLFGIKFAHPSNPLMRAISEELFVDRPTTWAGWDATRNTCCAADLYYPHPKIQDALWWGLARAERWLVGSRLRKRALVALAAHVAYEDANTRFICIGPVNKALNLVVRWCEGGRSRDAPAFAAHLARVPDYLWVAEDGLKMQGYNGSQLWDTAFAVQALGVAGPALCAGEPAVRGALAAAARYVAVSQVQDEASPAPLAAWYRHASLGAWPFSTRDHGWTISDCTAEGLKAALALDAMGEGVTGVRPDASTGAGASGVPPGRLAQAVDMLLSYQNPGSGGWATYELTRSTPWLEVINPAESFGDIVVDYPYVECSSACVTALAAFRASPGGGAYRRADVDASIDAGIRFILDDQRPDGSWYGSWGVCFTYGAWFGCEALAAAGRTAATCPALRRACEFLVARQEADGGWGESYLSSVDKVYTSLPGGASQVVHTAWAMLALCKAGWVDAVPAGRGAAVLAAGAAALLRAQEPTGDWPQQHITGVFNRNCMITYANYRNIFPLWALGEYRKAVLQREERTPHGVMRQG